MSNEQAIISIIIPVYNVEEYIIDCLRSVVEQDVIMEILLIDDCGRDNSIAVAQSYLEAQPKLRPEQWRIIKHEKNRGLSAARNTGMDAASGKYIYFLDSDDYLPANSLKSLLDKAERQKATLTIGDIELDKGGYWQLRLDDKHLLKGDEVLEAYIRRQWFEMAWNKLILREFLIENKLYFIEGLIHEDEVWSLRLACLQPSLACVLHETYFYRNDRVGSIMNQCRKHDRLKASLNRLIVFNHCIQILDEFRLLANWLVQHNFIQTIQLDYLFLMPKKHELTWREKMTHYAYFAKYYSPALRKRCEHKFDWRFRVLAVICHLPQYLASVILQIFLLLWKLRPGVRLSEVLTQHK